MRAVRSRGEIRLGFRAEDGTTRIGAGYQSGCLKFRLPRTAPREAPCAVILNTSGGLTGGDRLIQRVDWGARSAAIVTTQAAEKIYRAVDEPATIETRLHVAQGARAEWLPQESIFFDQARLVRDTQVRIAGDADFLGVEAVVLGRTAMDEVVERGMLVDRWRIWRDGRLVYADALRLDGPIDDLMRRPAIGAGARAMAVIILAAPRAATRLAPLQLALDAARGTAAASSWNGMTVARLLAGDGAILRHDLLLALASLRESGAMPRVWNC
ncbi:urease accessory protein UreD [Rhizorhabdus argentea]|uniref:urease accessory protein UreD n=1 Tax=Rhizorhabdus argentea TaxID=1387174 RepID=UPI0030EC448E